MCGTTLQNSAPVLQRGMAVGLAEAARKVAGIRKAAAGRDILDAWRGLARIGEYFPRTLQAQFHQLFDKGRTRCRKSVVQGALGNVMLRCNNEGREVRFLQAVTQGDDQVAE